MILPSSLLDRYLHSPPLPPGTSYILPPVLPAGMESNESLCCVAVAGCKGPTRRRGSGWLRGLRRLRGRSRAFKGVQGLSPRGRKWNRRHGAECWDDGGLTTSSTPFARLTTSGEELDPALLWDLHLHLFTCTSIRFMI